MLWSTLRFLTILIFVVAIFPLRTQIGIFQIYPLDFVILPSIFVLASIATLGRGMKFAIKTTDKLIFGFLFCITIFSVFSSSPINTLHQVLVWYRVVAVYYFVRVLVENNELGIEDVYSWWKWTLVFLCILGAIQVLVDPSIGIAANYFGNKLEGSGDIATFKELGSVPRISGTSYSPLIYVQWIVIFSSIVNARLLFKNTMSVRVVSSYIFLLILEFSLVVATLSRGGVLFLLVVNVLLIYFRLGRQESNRAISVVRLLMLLMAFTFVVVYFVQSDQFTAVSALEIRAEQGGENRIQLFVQGWKLFQNPKIFFMGTGLGAYYPALFGYGIGLGDIVKWKDMTESSSGIHNMFANILVEGGLLSASLYIFLVGLTVKKSYRMMKVLVNTKHDFVGVYLFSLMTGFVVVSFQLYLSSLNINVLLFEFVIFAIVHSIDIDYLRHWAWVERYRIRVVQGRSTPAFPEG